MMSILFAKCNEAAIIPCKRTEDAGYDIYGILDSNCLELKPGETVGIKTGLMSCFDSNLKGIIKERGSTAKYGLGVRAGVIDSGFRGEWIIFLTNHSNKTIFFHDDNFDTESVEAAMFYNVSKAICQVCFEQVPLTCVMEVETNDVQSKTSKRGTGMLGSSLK